MGSGPLGFLANPQLSMNLVCLYQLPLVLGSHATQACSWLPNPDMNTKTVKISPIGDKSGLSEVLC